MEVAANSGWAAVYQMMAEHDGYSPREVKAQAMALTVLGYSSREIERELRRRFPGKHVPPFSTIARWQRSRPANWPAALRWIDVAHRAAVIVEAGLDKYAANPLEHLKEILEIWKACSGTSDRARSAVRFFDRARRN